MFIGNTKDGYPKPDGKYTFDKLSSVFITGNATRDDAPNHIRVRKHVPREIAETWRWMCPAGVYEIPEDAPDAWRRGRDRQLHQLRAVRRDHRQGRSPDDPRGRRRTALSDDLSALARAESAVRAGAGFSAGAGAKPARTSGVTRRVMSTTSSSGCTPRLSWLRLVAVLACAVAAPCLVQAPAAMGGTSSPSPPGAVAVCRQRRDRPGRSECYAREPRHGTSRRRSSSA